MIGSNFFTQRIKDVIFLLQVDKDDGHLLPSCQGGQVISLQIGKHDIHKD
uniref:Uncharacterized protein n=1 Tax=Arion vulgaris TaxID=1028688 RepID=A0A0B7AMZ9_9EUPU